MRKGFNYKLVKFDFLQKHLNNLDVLHLALIFLIFASISINIWQLKNPFTEETTTSLEANDYSLSSSLEKNEIETLSENIIDETKKIIPATPNVTEEESLVPEISNIAEDTYAIFTIKRGDTLYKIFNDAGISPNDSHRIFREIKKIFKVGRLQIGDTVEINFANTDDNDYYSIPKSIILNSHLKKIEILYNEATNKYTGKTVKAPIELKNRLISSEIKGNLYTSAQKKGLDKTTIANFISLFSHNIDFQRDIRDGDAFTLLEEYYETPEGKKLNNKKIVYAALNVKGKHIEMFRHENENGSAEYYDRDGNNIRKTLLQTPVNGARISGRFGMRKHPVLGYSRMHKGLDYAAPRGTPILAAGDGTVVFTKRSKGYGKYIKIKHSANYATLYAHLDKFAKGMRAGRRVTQGEVIGYVGSTGLATGPHLHYEVHVKGKQVNPATVKFSKAPPLDTNKMVAFKESVKSIDTLISNHG